MGLLLGTVSMRFVGVLVGPLLGAAVEVFLGMDFAQALQVGLGSLMGLLGATVLKFIFGYC